MGSAIMWRSDVHLSLSHGGAFVSDEFNLPTIALKLFGLPLGFNEFISAQVMAVRKLIVVLKEPSFFITHFAIAFI